ncbi:DnaA N-terminal domain-containing protein [Tropicibacter sp. S64]|uniref:DnaA N-terminal domain-containing protein n=1 Tax=Tropicibacter sp. S64 TaxID=3415122 RepID=UPI003C7CEE59
MLSANPARRTAASRKYDILAALSVCALSQDKHAQRRALRLIALITARYNWQTNALSIGRAEIARLWSVDERTVKREMAQFREAGWITVKRPAARGRVAVYALDFVQMLKDTRMARDLLGPDFAERLETEEPRAPEESTVVPFKRPVPEDGPGLWGQVSAVLHDRDPALYATWFQHLRETRCGGGQVVLSAPTPFMADYVATHLSGPLLAAYGRFDPGLRSLRVEAR